MRSHGFTLIELVAIIVIVGILAAVALPRWQGETGFEARQFRDETVAALRLAQKSAIAARRTVCAAIGASQVSFRISTGYGASDCSSGSVLASPGGGDLEVRAAGGVAYSTFPTSIVFDAAGRPISGAANIVVSSLAGLPVTVEAETGHVH